MILSADEVNAIKAWGKEIKGCTCPTEYVNARYVVAKNVCEYCLTFHGDFLSKKSSNASGMCDNVAI